MARKKKEQDPREVQLKELFDSLVAGKTPEEIFGKGSLMSQLRKRLAESALQGRDGRPARLYIAGNIVKQLRAICVRSIRPNAGGSRVGLRAICRYVDDVCR